MSLKSIMSTVMFATASQAGSTNPELHRDFSFYVLFGNCDDKEVLHLFRFILECIINCHLEKSCTICVHLIAFQFCARLWKPTSRGVLYQSGSVYQLYLASTLWNKGHGLHFNSLLWTISSPRCLMFCMDQRLLWYVKDTLSTLIGSCKMWNFGFWDCSIITLLNTKFVYLDKTDKN